MAKLQRPEDNAKEYRAEEMTPAPKGYKPNRFALRHPVAPEEVHITTALDLYFDEHLHRTPEVVCQIEKTIVDFLETNGLEAKNRLRLITKPLCRRFALKYFFAQFWWDSRRIAADFPHVKAGCDFELIAEHLASTSALLSICSSTSLHWLSVSYNRSSDLGVQGKP